jgi:hypothetical protein
MRGVFKGVARGVVAAAVVMALAVPAEAKPTDDGWTPSKIVKALKRLVVKTLGDGVIIPRP